MLSTLSIQRAAQVQVRGAEAWSSVVAACLEQARQRTGSTRTPDEYGRILARFLAAVGDPAAATAAHVHGFAYAPGPSGKVPSPSTVIVRLAAIRGLYDLARRSGLIAANPTDDVQRPRQRPAAPRGLDTAELRRLLDALPATPGGLRDRALLLTAMLTGLRRRELLALTAGSLTREHGAVYYRVRAKGGQERYRELPAPAADAIATACAARGEVLAALPPEARLFPISSQGFAANLARYAGRADLGHVAPHALRHSAAKLRRGTGASLEDVSAFLGHRNLATTARYLARLEGERDDGWRAAATALGLD